MCCADEPYQWQLQEAQVLTDAVAWVRVAKRRDLLELVGWIAGDYREDQALQDANRRAQTVAWLASRGIQGSWHPKLTPERFLAKRQAGL